MGMWELATTVIVLPRGTYVCAKSITIGSRQGLSETCAMITMDSIATETILMERSTGARISLLYIIISILKSDCDESCCVYGYVYLYIHLFR